jgi:hypothetical protein
MLPTPESIASLTLTLARTGLLVSAMRLYSHLRANDFATLVPLTRSHGQMFEQLLELNCRESRVQPALEIFDDWKAASDLAMQVAARSPFAGDEAAADGAALRAPRLSTVTLAFLEACCHSSPKDMQWRVYDVCAVMRRQQELKALEAQDRPHKSSHHFYEVGDEMSDAGAVSSEEEYTESESDFSDDEDRPVNRFMVEGNL